MTKGVTIKLGKSPPDSDGNRNPKSLTLCLPVSSADNTFKQFGKRSGPMVLLSPDMDPNYLTL